MSAPLKALRSSPLTSGESLGPSTVPCAFGDQPLPTSWVTLAHSFSHWVPGVGQGGVEHSAIPSPDRAICLFGLADSCLPTCSISQPTAWDSLCPVPATPPRLVRAPLSLQLLGCPLVPLSFLPPPFYGESPEMRNPG